jgi:hypothetical protein
MGFIKIGSPELFPQGWLQTTILLISASWVARITGMRHEPPVSSFGNDLTWKCYWKWNFGLQAQTPEIPYVRSCPYISNKETWWRSEKGDLLHTWLAVGRGRISTLAYLLGIDMSFSFK